MFLQRIMPGLLMAFLVICVISPANLAAQEICAGPALSSHERALLEVHGQVILDLECADGCANDAGEAVASYERAIQAQDNVLVDIECADGCSNDGDDSVAVYERAILQAHGQVMADSFHADCGVRA